MLPQALLPYVVKSGAVKGDPFFAGGVGGVGDELSELVCESANVPVVSAWAPGRTLSGSGRATID